MGLLWNTPGWATNQNALARVRPGLLVAGDVDNGIRPSVLNWSRHNHTKPKESHQHTNNQRQTHPESNSRWHRRTERGLTSPAQCGAKNDSRRKGNNSHLLDCGGENHPRPTRTSRASASRGRHRRRDRAGESRTTARGGRKEKTQHEDDDRRWKEREHTSPRDADVANASPGRRPPSRCA